MADLFSRIGMDAGQYRVCSKCGIFKPLGDFASRRAHCRPCYNVIRRAHYALPEVKAEKNAKRSAYVRRPDVAESLKIRRAAPETKAREREALKRYRATPQAKEKANRWREKYLSNPEVKARKVFLAALSRAKMRGLAFSLTECWVRDRIRSGVCELTGIPFDYGLPKNGWKNNPFTPSIDRISSSAGYTDDNCRLVLTAVNIALGQWGLDILTTIAVALVKR